MWAIGTLCASKLKKIKNTVKTLDKIYTVVYIFGEELSRN
jgi:hypothetical protein